VGNLKRKTKQKRDSDASDSLDSDFGSSAAEDVESDEVSSAGISEAEEHEAAVVTKAPAPGHQAKRRPGSSSSRKPTAQKQPGQQQHQKRQRKTPTQLVSGSHWLQQMASGEDQSPAAAAAAPAPAADVPGQADWDLQLALQLSLQDSPDLHAGSGVAELPGVNNIMNRAVNLNDDQQQQLNHQQQQQQQQPASKQQPAATTQTAQRHDDNTTRQQSASTSEVQGAGRSSSGVKSKRGSKKKAPTAASPGWTAADLFDLFAMFEPADGVVTKQDIVKQMLKAGLEADDNLLDNMMQYAKQLVEQQAQLLGRAVTRGSNSNSLEYEEFALLGQYIDAAR
jgi:hypothetical protein